MIRTQRSVIVIAVMTIAVTAFGQDSALMKADAAFSAAITAHDRAALDNVLDADFTWTRADGAAKTRSEVLQQLPKTAIGSEKDAESRVFTYGDLGDVQVNQRRFHVLRVWVKRSGRWKAIVYQEVTSLDAPAAFTPGAGKDCNNPCKSIPFTPRNDTEREVALAYSKLETAAHARNSAAFAPMLPNCGGCHGTVEPGTGAPESRGRICLSAGTLLSNWRGRDTGVILECQFRSLFGCLTIRPRAIPRTHSGPRT